MAKRTVINNEEKNVISTEAIESSGTGENNVILVYEDGTEKSIAYTDIPAEEKRITDEHFKAFVSVSSFDSIAHNLKWNAPHIGMHEDGKLHIFFSEKNVPVKKYVSESFSDIQLQQFKTDYKPEIRICNQFLSDIASGKGINDVKAVKEALNNINAGYLKISLECINSNDETYTLSATNTMVRVRLVDKAKANKLSTGFKALKIIDVISFFIEAMASEYKTRTADNK